MNVSISVAVGKGSINHNNREYSAENVDKSRSKDNIVFVQKDLREVYRDLFDKPLSDYNAKKKKTRDKIPDYYEHIKRSRQEKLFHEAIFQIGGKDTCPCGTPAGDSAATALAEFARTFQDRNPNLRVFNMTLHMDEATPHLHVDFVPVATNQKRGLSTRVTLKGALKEQGFEAESRKHTEWAIWANSERSVIADIAQQYGLEYSAVGGPRRKNLTPEQYRQTMREAEELAQQKLDAADKQATAILDDARAEGWEIVQKATEDAQSVTEAAQSRSTAILDGARAEGREIVQRATEDAQSVTEAAQSDATAILDDARAEGREIVQRATEDAQSVTEAAQSDATAILDDATQERAELLGELREASSKAVPSAYAKAEEMAAIADSAKPIPFTSTLVVDKGNWDRLVQSANAGAFAPVERALLKEREQELDEWEQELSDRDRSLQQRANVVHQRERTIGDWDSLRNQVASLQQELNARPTKGQMQELQKKLADANSTIARLQAKVNSLMEHIRDMAQAVSTLVHGHGDFGQYKIQGLSKKQQGLMDAIRQSAVFLLARQGRKDLSDDVAQYHGIAPAIKQHEPKEKKRSYDYER